MAHISYKTESKNNNWGITGDVNTKLSIDEIKLGTILRIADAIEKIADNHPNLIQRVESLEQTNNYLLEENQKLTRRIAGLRGYVKRVKK